MSAMTAVTLLRVCLTRAADNELAADVRRIELSKIGGSLTGPNQHYLASIEEFLR